MTTSHEPRRPIRVAIIDDHPIFRDGLKHLLDTEPDIDVVDTGTSGFEANRIVQSSQPDVLILDYGMQDLNGVDTLCQLPSSPTQVMLLTAAIEPEEVIRAIQFGARAVVLKESPTERLLAAIRDVAAGKYVVGADTMGDLAQALAALNLRATRPYGLTPREFEIVAGVADGATNQELADRLSISVQTVKHHLTSIFDKLGVSTRLELGLFAIDHSLVRRRAPQRE